jgi:hypothetical protein
LIFYTRSDASIAGMDRPLARRRFVERETQAREPGQAALEDDIRGPPPSITTDVNDIGVSKAGTATRVIDHLKNDERSDI